MIFNEISIFGANEKKRSKEIFFFCVATKAFLSDERGDLKERIKKL